MAQLAPLSHCCTQPKFTPFNNVAEISTTVKMTQICLTRQVRVLCITCRPCLAVGWSHCPSVVDCSCCQETCSSSRRHSLQDKQLTWSNVCLLHTPSYEQCRRTSQNHSFRLYTLLGHCRPPYQYIGLVIFIIFWQDPLSKSQIISHTN